MPCPVKREIQIRINDADRLMRGTIVVLNAKCYFTMFSCQGHYKSLKPTYIVFYSTVHVPYLPDGFEMHRRYHRGTRKYRWWMVDWDMETRTEIEKNDALFEWAKKLPSNCSEKNKDVAVRLIFDEESSLVLDRE